MDEMAVSNSKIKLEVNTKELGSMDKKENNGRKVGHNCDASRQQAMGGHLGNKVKQTNLFFKNYIL